MSSRPTPTRSAASCITRWPTRAAGLAARDQPSQRYPDRGAPGEDDVPVARQCLQQREQQALTGRVDGHLVHVIQDQGHVHRGAVPHRLRHGPSSELRGARHHRIDAAGLGAGWFAGCLRDKTISIVAVPGNGDSYDDKNC